jgi:type II secretory pathway component PulF
MNCRRSKQILPGARPWRTALKPRQLPELYKRMILVGVKGGDLPGALTMLADYFQTAEQCLDAA